MPDDPAVALHEQAREWGRVLLAAAPWSAVSDRVTLLIVAPPAGIEPAAPPANVVCWLVIDEPAARSLPREYHEPLLQSGSLIERRRGDASAPPVTLTLFAVAALERLLDGIVRRSIETRWSVLHSEVVSDRLRRRDQLGVRAARLPQDAVERVVRPLWLEANAAMHALETLGASPGDSLPAAGELAGALTRIACFIDDGAYPPTEWLLPASAETRIGQRVAGWLGDLVPALSGDERAARRVIGSRAQVRDEVRAVLREQFPRAVWLHDPDAYALRAPR